MSILKKGNPSGYKWRFGNVAGETRVLIENGQDIAHLGELDRKMWTVLSCPVQGLELDQVTLEMMDTNHDGKIHADELIAAVEWTTSLLNDPEQLLAGEDEMPLSALNTSSEAGMRIYDSARRILSGLGKEKDTISVSDVADETAIFAKTALNGDGIVTVQSTADDGLKKTIEACMATVGSVQDRSTLPGVDEGKVNAFYDACAAYAAWQEGCTANILPYGADTEAALSAWKAVRDKVDDYFMRCRLVAFDSESSKVLDVQMARLEAISANNLTGCMDEIAGYPLARISQRQELPLAEGINPAWQGAFETLKKLVLAVDFAGREAITEAEWNTLAAKFAPYEAWKGAKAGEAVESLGLDAVKEYLSQNRKADLLRLIAEDKALEKELNAVAEVNRMLHYCRDLCKLIRNYVTFSDFYRPDVKAVFQAGTLFIDQRSCDLCIRVTDMGAHNASAGLSGMYLIYCTCTSKLKAAPMNIVAVLTNGEVKNLRVGMNAIFYDRSGLDWDAVVTKIVDNPISVREAFLSPYRKFGKFCSEQIGKLASEKEGKITGDMQKGISHVSAEAAAVTPETAGAAKPAAGKQAFDMSKFLGLFAVIGMALGTICGFLLDLLKGFAALSWWKMILVVVALMLVISGPSMLLAWLKLRRRNLAPLLNANGWAINASVLVNAAYGARLTDMAVFPVLKLSDTARKKRKCWKAVLWTVIGLAVAFAALYFTNVLSFIGLSFR